MDNLSAVMLTAMMSDEGFEAWLQQFPENERSTFRLAREDTKITLAKVNRAFKLLMELREKAEDYMICLISTGNLGGYTDVMSYWQTRYNNARWKAGILERYIQEKLK